MRIHLTSFLGLVCTLAIASAAHADEESATPAAPRYTQEKDLRLDLTTGIASDTSATVGAMALARYGLFEAGVDGSVATQVFGYSYRNVSAAAGLGWQAGSGLRLDILAELGATSYSNVGSGFFGGTDPGVSGWTGTVRGKVGLSYVFFPRAKSHLALGLWAYADDDLSRQNISSHYMEATSFGGSTAMTTNHTLGTSRVGSLFSVGGVVPL